MVQNGRCVRWEWLRIWQLPLVWYIDVLWVSFAEKISNSGHKKKSSIFLTQNIHILCDTLNQYLVIHQMLFPSIPLKSSSSL